MRNSSVGQRLWLLLIISLAVIGICMQVIFRPLHILLVIVVIGTIYYLYKYPPDWLIRLSRQPYAVEKNRKKKRRKHSFYVIDGKKKQTR